MNLDCQCGAVLSNGKSGAWPSGARNKMLLFFGELCLGGVVQGMGAHVSYKINSPQVISQLIEGEVVVINLLTGSYYSLTGTAATIWEAAQRGLAGTRITDALAARYSDCGAGLEGIVNDFLKELQGESLIIPAADDMLAGDVWDDTLVERQKFVRPALKKFTDMQELLLLDPIHEVDATGWPLAKSAPNNNADH
jgi:Coenzyme PQQ synthesis protein D (PqqD)